MNKIMNYKFDGSRVFHMNETIIANWNSVVGPDDIIFHLGDFCLGGSAEWINVLNRLNGKIYLIAGNHDIKDLRQNYTKYFEQITMQMHIEVGKRSIYLNHYPFLCYSGAYGDVWQLFGHVHTCPNSTGIDTPRLGTLLPTQYDVGVDNNNYMPVSYEQVKKNILKQINKTRNEKEK